MNVRKTNINWSTVALIALVAGVVGHATNANRAAPTSPSVVAVLDLEALFQGLDERGSADTQLMRIAEDLDARGTLRREEIELLSQDLELYSPGSPQYQETSREVARKGFELQAFLDFAMRKLDAEKARTLRRLYDRIKSTVETISKENGYDLVLVDDSIVSLPIEATEAETMRQISARRMLYGSPQINITQDVIARMNQEFSRPQGG